MAGSIPDAALGSALTAELTALALCWRIVRRDGVALGFTTHDRPLAIGGLRYESAPGMAPSAVVASDGLDIDTMEVAGALSDDAITDADLGCGRYDGAEVQLFMVDRRMPAAGAQRLAIGTLGTVESGVGPDAGFAASLRGPTAAMLATRIETYSPECRAELGDWRCRAAMRGRSIRASVTFADGERIGVAGVTDAGDFVEGRVRILAGPWAGIERRIIAVDGAVMTLNEPLSIGLGLQVELREGCDKRFATCAGRFGNSGNFRGEPHVPGGDVLTRVAGL